MLRSCAMGLCGDQHHSTGDDDICETSDLQLHNAILSDSSERESTSILLPERISAPPNPDAHDAVENEAGRIREDENATYQEEGITQRLLIFCADSSTTAVKLDGLNQNATRHWANRE